MTLDASSASRPSTTAPRAPRSTGRTSRTRRSRSSSCPPTADEMAGADREDDERTPWLVVEVDGAVRGYAYGTRHRDRAAYDWTVETTVYVDRDFAGRGIGRAAMTALLDGPAAPGVPSRRGGHHAAQPGVHGAPPGAGVRANRRVRGHRLEGRAAGTASSGTASSSDRETGRRRRSARWRTRSPTGSAPGPRRRPRPADPRPAPAGTSATPAAAVRARTPRPGQPGVDDALARPPREAVLVARRRRQQADRRDEQPVVGDGRDGAQDRARWGATRPPSRAAIGPDDDRRRERRMQDRRREVAGGRRRVDRTVGREHRGDVRVEGLDVRAAAGPRARRTGGRSARVSA